MNAFALCLINGHVATEQAELPLMVESCMPGCMPGQWYGGMTGEHSMTTTLQPRDYGYGVITGNQLSHKVHRQL